MPKTLDLIINDPIELNLSYIPFIKEGGLFIPTTEKFILGDRVILYLKLPGKIERLCIEGQVVWIIPKIALYHVIPGIGIQLVGNNAKTICNEIEAHLDPSIEVGGYTYGITDDSKK